ncbi:MAG TPA: MlaD family protein [Polyangiaceae bacterium]|nr:MlaD family protein [Polyangiaceae bacterium]
MSDSVGEPVVPGEGTRRLEVYVGIFVCLAIALGVLVVLLLGRSHHVFAQKVVLHAEFTDVQGLRAGAPVRLSGVDVGTVDRVAFSPSRANTAIQVDLKVTPEALERIGQDSVARIGSQGLLGDKLIEISIASAGSPPLHPGDTLATVPPADLNRVVEQVGQTLERVKHVADDAGRVMDAFAEPRTVRHVQGAIASIDGLLKQSERGPGLVHSLFYDPEQARAFSRLLTGTDQLLVQVQRGVRDVDALLEPSSDDGRHLVDNLSRAAREVGATATAVRTSTALPNLEKATGDLAEMTGALKSGQGTLGALIADPTVYEQLVTVLGGVARSRILRALVRYAISRDDEGRVAGRVVDGSYKRKVDGAVEVVHPGPPPAPAPTHAGR